MLVDNDTAFHSKVFRDFLSEWGVRLHSRCAHVPSSNGIVERCHRSVERIAARKQCPIMEADYWYNVTNKDNVLPLTVLANLIHRYHVWLTGINALPPDKPKQQQMRYDVGNHVGMKTPNGHYTSPYTHGCVTGVISPQDVLSCKGPASHHRLEYLGEWEWLNSKPEVQGWSTQWSPTGKQCVCNGWHFCRWVVLGGRTITTKER